MDKATLFERDNKSKEVVFQFNPSTIKFSRSAQYDRKKSQGAKKGPPVQFIGAGPTELSLQLLLDGVGPGKSTSVADKVNQLLDWLAPTGPSAKGTSPSPPVLQFTWGQLKLAATGTYTGYLQSVAVTYKLFNEDGEPIRAEVDIKLQDIPQNPKGTNPTSGALRTHRTRQLTRGETLQSIAQSEYGDAALWRGIAATNGIDDPLRVRPGTDLLIPEAGQLRQEMADAG